MVFSKTLKEEIGNGYNDRFVIKTLKAAGWLDLDTAGRAARFVHIPGLGKKIQCYIFNSRVWEGHDSPTDDAP